MSTLTVVTVLEVFCKCKDSPNPRSCTYMSTCPWDERERRTNTKRSLGTRSGMYRSTLPGQQSAGEGSVSH